MPIVTTPAASPSVPANTEVDTHRFLQDSLVVDRENAWSIAHYEREQSDKLTSQIRFGLTAANAASLVTVLNVAGSLKGVDPSAIAWSAAFFLSGTVLAGYSLVSQQNRLIEKAGNAGARAGTLDRAVKLSRYPPPSPQYEALGDAMKEAHELHLKTFRVPHLAITLQHGGMGAWIAGALSVAVPDLAVASPAIARAVAWVQHLF